MLSSLYKITLATFIAIVAVAALPKSPKTCLYTCPQDCPGTAYYALSHGDEHQSFLYCEYALDNSPNPEFALCIYKQADGALTHAGDAWPPFESDQCHKSAVAPAC